MSWSPPTTLGHTTGYNIYYKTGDVLSNITIEISNTNHLLSNLMNGASYNISIVGTSEHLYSEYVNIPNLIPLGEFTGLYVLIHAIISSAPLLIICGNNYACSSRETNSKN